MSDWSAHLRDASGKMFTISAIVSSTLEKVALFLTILGLLVPAFVK